MAQLEFTHSQDNLKNLANQILSRATALGATSAHLEINESIETSVDVLNGNIESVETSYDSNIGLTVYVGENRGNVGISQVPPADLDMIIRQALDIAKYTQADPLNGIADKEDLCTGFTENLQLYNPIAIDNAQIIQQAIELEKIGLNTDRHITASDGAAISLGKYNFIIANTNGFNLGYTTTRYSKSLSLIGQTKSGMQTDYWYSNARDYNDLDSNRDLATQTISRVKRRLNKGKIKSGSYSVVFESTIAKSLIGIYLNAISGSSLYRKLSFLNNSINTQIFPGWLNITEDPFVIKGSSSCYFDNEGVNVCKRDLVKNGIVSGYLLSCYSARKLGMRTTGNAGGNHNIQVSSNITGDINSLAAKIECGLIVVETIGHGVNMVTGDYSVGASGLWVEKGEIKFFVDGLTIAGNLKTIFQSIKYISNDYRAGSIQCGSMLVDGIDVSI
ncbi:MAG: pmbA [Burkholderiales bacterium]|jgi:PmbA protein|nr:pmbA [Burkholderiales bacterium]